MRRSIRWSLLAILFLTLAIALVLVPASATSMHGAQFNHGTITGEPWPAPGQIAGEPWPAPGQIAGEPWPAPGQAA